MCVSPGTYTPVSCRWLETVCAARDCLVVQDPHFTGCISGWSSAVTQLEQRDSIRKGFSDILMRLIGCGLKLLETFTATEITELTCQLICGIVM